MVLQNLGLLHQDIWVLFWPGALLLFGFMGLVARGPLHFWGHVMLFFGVVMLMNNLGYEWVPERWWPVGLVWGGLVLVLRSLLKPALPACQDASRGSHD